ncbi:MAG TPA: XdhC/CoxI family protein [Planctomycetota bacterium]|nr:XdhC/CoxI family protein [Planctomycetota bacterium]
MRAIQRRILELLEEGRAFAVATVAAAKGSVPGKPGAKMVVLADGTATGTVGGAGLEQKVKALCLRAIEERRGGLHAFDLMAYKEGGLDSLCGGSVQILVEYMAPTPHLLIAGGGHCGLEVARLCGTLGYVHSVLDDRPEYASPARFPEARRTIHATPETFFQAEDLSPYTHVLLVGWSHKIDTELLFHLVQKFPRWIGLISSRTKRLEMFRRLRARGISEEALARVVAPVGLPIGAETPAEIAVSILAQVIRDVKGAAPEEDGLATKARSHEEKEEEK